MSHPSLTNIGAYIKNVLGVTAFATAGGTGDNTEAVGPVIDRYVTERSDIPNGATSIAMSAVLTLIASATLAAGKKCTYVLDLYHDTAAGGGTKAKVADALQPGGKADSVVLTLTDSGAGGVSTGSFEFDVNLESLNRYIVVSVIPDLNAANTDTSFMCVSVTLGGVKHLPI